LATTTLSIANRQTVVIGGLRERRDVGDFRGIPYLMEMKYLGKLFRYRKTDIRESELMLFISPEIISTADPVDTREQRVIDTVGCRLNQIPAGEGCVPPPCVCQPIGQPLDLSSMPTADPNPLPEANSTAWQPPNTGGTASASNRAAQVAEAPRRLPAPDVRPTTLIAIQGNDLLSVPPTSEVDLSVPDTSKPQVGGWIEVGGRPGAMIR
jgi:hypothetical protein